jgi:mannosyl-oligosaccharide glucosidase
MDILWKSKYWQRSAGRDHVIPMHHPNAFRFLRDMVNASVLIVSDFGRYTKELASLKKDVVAPYVHVVDSFLNDDPSDPYDARPTLLFFRGRTVRKDVCNQFLKSSIPISSFSPAFIVVKYVSRV